uniref:Cysteine-rich membrane protein 2 n=1 Tax=Spironucleus salmonicida TaxID=348837 RepID=V6LXP8_9EUKA|eukprot:EST49325.1 Cysteine-rich membrane protein 2 [Spironucleus salmonicida]
MPCEKKCADCKCDQGGCGKCKENNEQQSTPDTVPMNQQPKPTKYLSVFIAAAITLSIAIVLYQYRPQTD